MSSSRKLPEDVVVDILIRLPVKYLTRFKSVSPGWNSLISSPSFVALHRDRSISDPSRQLALVRLGHFGARAPIPPHPINSVLYWHHEYKKLVGSVNGLVCVVGLDTEKFDDIYVWNPSTKMSKKLPVGRLTTSKRVAFGFGWDRDADAYKLLKIASGDDTIAEAEMWSSGSDSWKRVEIGHKFHHPHCLARITFADATVKAGSICHWIVMVDAVGSLSDFKIASFHMSTEVMKTVSMPKIPVRPQQLLQDLEDKNECVFGINWKDEFALVERYSVGSSVARGFALWTMDGDGDGDRTWSKKSTFRIDDRFSFVLNSFDEKILLKTPKTLMLYDMRTGQARAIGDAGVQGNRVGEASFVVESLVAVDGFGKEGEEIRFVDDDDDIEDEQNAEPFDLNREGKVNFFEMVSALYNIMKEESLKEMQEFE